MLTTAVRPRTPLGYKDKYQTVPSSSTVILLEKAEPIVETFGGVTTMDKIGDALDEFSRLFQAGLASDAEILTLARAFPENPTYTTAAIDIPDEAVMVVGGPASVELIDREGHLITTNALRSAFKKYMDNFRTRNAMVLHSDVQVGWALPAYITKGGMIYKSDVGVKGLFFLCEIRNDTKIADRVREQIKYWKLKSYSIAGSDTKVQIMSKGIMPYMQVDEMELAEVTVCEKGVNQGATFELLKAEQTEQTGKISKDQCGYRDATPAELEMNISCGSCVYFNEKDNTCDTVVGRIDAEDYCIVYKPEDSSPTTMDTEDAKGMKIEIHLSKQANGSVNFTRSFLDLIKGNPSIPEYNKVDALKQFMKGITPVSAKGTATTPEMEGQDEVRGIEITPAEFEIPSIGGTRTGGGGGKMELSMLDKMEKYISDSQKQWTLEDEPPSFNWGPYGLQSKSNVGV